MELGEYQRTALKSRKRPKRKGHDTELMIPILGLAGEAGELLNEYKKRLRDGEAHTRFSDRVAEELGDILWYVADTASHFDLKLEEVARRNLEKTQARWGSHGKLILGKPHGFDDEYPHRQRFPRRFTADFRQHSENGVLKTLVFVSGAQMGQGLTDNSWEPDGYQFHDVFHLACVAVLGWSPVCRRNLGIKRKRSKKVDEVEDGGRAIVTEEGISALIFAYAIEHNRLKGVSSVDYELLKAIKIMTAPFEISVATTGEWERAILDGYNVWKKVEKNKGGKVSLDLDRRTIKYKGRSEN